eukprot:451770-Prymnesium_polylepis.2
MSPAVMYRVARLARRALLYAPYCAVCHVHVHVYVPCSCPCPCPCLRCPCPSPSSDLAMSHARMCVRSPIGAARTCYRTRDVSATCVHFDLRVRGAVASTNKYRLAAAPPAPSEAELCACGLRMELGGVAEPEAQAGRPNCRMPKEESNRAMPRWRISIKTLTGLDPKSRAVSIENRKTPVTAALTSVYTRDSKMEMEDAAGGDGD